MIFRDLFFRKNLLQERAKIMRLFEARARKRRTQWDLRLITGINQSKISLIERGYICPTEKEKNEIAKALDFDVNEIEWTHNPIN